MTEPQPPNVHEGIDGDDAPPPAPASAEDRKAAAAMSSLESRGNDDEAEAKQDQNKTVDQKDLVNAISRLAVDEPGAGDKVKTEKDEKKEKEKEEAARRAKVKVDQADVGLLVEELDLTKVKATELLKAHEGNAVKAMRAFVIASA